MLLLPTHSFHYILYFVKLEQICYEVYAHFPDCCHKTQQSLFFIENILVKTIFQNQTLNNVTNFSIFKV